MKCIEVKQQTAEKAGKALSDSVPVLMLYRMEFCPHCVAMRESWMEVRKSLEKEKGIVVAEVEYSNMNILPTHLQNIRGFPTLQLIKNNKVHAEYSGDRSAKSIMDFALSYVPKAKEPAPKKAAAPRKKPAAKKA